MASLPLDPPTLRRCLEAAESERPPPSLTDDLLEEIFLRVTSTADLARASTACVSFRRLIADPSFLRRYRSLHPPLLVGIVSSNGLAPVEAPHPNAAAARALARAADFSFGFLPLGDCDWNLCDVHDGRLLIEFVRLADYDEIFWNLLVCDPLSRRYLLLPPVADDLLASVELLEQKILTVEDFLIPCEDGEEETSFRVIRMMFDETRLVAFIFSSGSGLWSVGTSTSWDALSLDEPPDYTYMDVLVSRNYAYGCFCWKVCDLDKFLKLDVDKMEFSTDDLPSDHDERFLAIVEAGEGKLGMFSRNYEGMSVDFYTFSQNGAERANEWHMKNTIPLPAHGTCHIIRAVHGHLFLEARRKDQDMEQSACFALDMKTFDIETISMRRNFGFFSPYFGYPPSLSPRRI